MLSQTYVTNVKMPMYPTVPLLTSPVKEAIRNITNNSATIKFNKSIADTLSIKRQMLEIISPQIKFGISFVF